MNFLLSFFTDHNNGSFNLKALSGGSGYKFGVLAKIVNYMKVLSFYFRCSDNCCVRNNVGYLNSNSSVFVSDRKNC